MMNESTLETIALDWIKSLGYSIAHGPDLAPGEAGAERASYGDVVLEGRLRESLGKRGEPVSCSNTHSKCYRSQADPFHFSRF